MSEEASNTPTTPDEESNTPTTPDEEPNASIAQNEEPADDPNTPTNPDFKPGIQGFLERKEKDQNISEWKNYLTNDMPNKTYTIPPEDDRDFILLEFRVVIEKGQTYIFDIQTPEGMAELKKGYNIPEGSMFHYELVFIIRKNPIIDLRFNAKTRKLLAQTITWELGSYPPTENPITKILDQKENPSGFLARGSYSSHFSFEDGNKKAYFSFETKYHLVKA